MEIHFSAKVTHKCYDFWNWVWGVSTFLDELQTQSGGNEANWSSLDNASVIISLRVSVNRYFILKVDGVLEFFFLARLRVQ